MASFKKVHELLCLCVIEEIIDEEEFVLLYEAYRPSNRPFPHCFCSRIKTQPNVKPISEWKRGIFLCFLTHLEYLLSSSAAMEQFEMELKACV